MTQAEIIAQAIRERRSLVVTINGRRWTVAPIQLGWKTTEEEGRHMRLLCYDVGEYSPMGLRPPGSLENHRCWKVDEVTSLAPSKVPWRGGFGLPKPGTCLDEVVVAPTV